MKNITTIARFTFIEVYRSKIMISLAILGFALIVLCYVASEFAYGAPAKIALDVGLGILSLSNVIIAVLIGATLLTREIEQKTLYMVLSKPISRAAFLFGKILGLSTILIINSIVLGSLSMILYKIYGGEFQQLVIWAIYFSFLEAFTLLLFAVLFSLMTNTTLSVIYSIGIFIVGHALNETSKLLFTKISVLFSTIVKICFVVIPNFYRLNLKDFVIYQQTVSTHYLVTTHLYLALYLTALLTALYYVFSVKNLD